MRTPPVSLLPALCCLLACAAAAAQVAPPPPDLSLLPSAAPARAAAPLAATSPTPASVGVTQPATGSRTDQRIERIRLEDNGTVVEEVHYGGQAQSITVTPKAAVPGYEIVPADGTRSRGLSRDALSAAPGQRVWNLLSF